MIGTTVRVKITGGDLNMSVGLRVILRSTQSVEFEFEVKGTSSK